MSSCGQRSETGCQTTAQAGKGKPEINIKSNREVAQVFLFCPRNKHRNYLIMNRQSMQHKIIYKDIVQNDVCFSEPRQTCSFQLLLSFLSFCLPQCGQDLLPAVSLLAKKHLPFCPLTISLSLTPRQIELELAKVNSFWIFPPGVFHRTAIQNKISSEKGSTLSKGKHSSSS